MTSYPSLRTFGAALQRHPQFTARSATYHRLAFAPKGAAPAVGGSPQVLSTRSSLLRRLLWSIGCD